MSIAGLRPSLPTRADDWRLMGRTVRLVLGLPVYAALALLTTVVALSAFVVGQNFALVEFALTAPIGFEDKATILFGLYPFLGTNYSLLAEVLLVAVAALAGVDVAMVVYHFREHGFGAEDGESSGSASSASGGDGVSGASSASGGGSAIGLALGALGAGCAACGSAVLAGVLSLFGVAGAATVLPFDGLEFSLLALVTLLLSVYWVADGMRGGKIRGCPV